MRKDTGFVVRAGVTLIELMVVIAIIIIVTASSAIAIGQNERNTLRSSALEVQAIVDRARQTALAQRSPTCVVVSPADGTFSFYATPTPTDTNVQRVVLRGGVKVPVQPKIQIAGEPLGAYFNTSSNDYIYTTARNIQISFDGFGRPNVVVLSTAPSSDWPAEWATPPQRSFGWVMLTVGSGHLAVQVVVYANSGTSELRWISN